MNTPNIFTIYLQTNIDFLNDFSNDKQNAYDTFFVN